MISLTWFATIPSSKKGSESQPISSQMTVQPSLTRVSTALLNSSLLDPQSWKYSSAPGAISWIISSMAVPSFPPILLLNIFTS